MAEAETHGDNLTDDDLQSEIELVGDLVVAATSSEGPLPQDEIDRLLGVLPEAREAETGAEQKETDGDEPEAGAES